MDAAAAISELVIANRVVAHLKLVDSFGHVSVRHPENPQRFFMSRSRAPSLVTKDDILEFDLDSNPIDARGLRPMAVTKTAMRPAIHSAAVIGREVPVWDIRDDFGDTDMLVSSNEM